MCTTPSYTVTTTRSQRNSKPSSRHFHQISTCLTKQWPPQRHRTRHPNLKAHLVSTLCTVNPLPSFHLWCRLLMQMDLMLNHMRASNIHPQLSAFNTLLDQLNFNQTTIIPHDTRVIFHQTPFKQKSFGMHSLEGWYIGPETDHYCCYKKIVNNIRETRFGKSVNFLLHH